MLPLILSLHTGLEGQGTCFREEAVLEPGTGNCCPQRGVWQTVCQMGHVLHSGLQGSSCGAEAGNQQVLPEALGLHTVFKCSISISWEKAVLKLATVGAA